MPRGDLDGDGITNLKEFLNGTDPANAADPRAVTFVGAAGADVEGRGSAAEPLLTIGFALQQIADSGLEEATIVLDAAVYQEDVTLLSGVTLMGRQDAEVFIDGTITGADGSVLENVTVRSLTGDENLLLIENVAMEVREVTFMGMESVRGAIGIACTGAMASGSLIAECDFVDLRIGINIFDGVPTIRRCIFTNPSEAGIYLRSTALVAGRNLERGHGRQERVQHLRDQPGSHQGRGRSPGHHQRHRGHDSDAEQRLGHGRLRRD